MEVRLGPARPVRVVKQRQELSRGNIILDCVYHIHCVELFIRKCFIHRLHESVCVCVHGRICIYACLNIRMVYARVNTYAHVYI